MAYKRELAAPVNIKYNFPHCKLNSENCEDCFLKVCKIANCIWKFTRNWFSPKISKLTIFESKILLFDSLKYEFASNFAKNFVKSNEVDSDKLLKACLN